MPHILVFTTAYLPLIGGAEVAISEITNRLSNKFKFTIITYRFSKFHPAYESHNGIEIIRLGTGSKFDRFFIFPFRAFWQARKIVKAQKIDLLWGVMVSYASIGAYFIKKFSPTLPLLLTLQEGDSEAHIGKSKFGLINLWWKLLIPKADYVQTISNYLKGLAEKNGARSVVVVPNGVSLERFKRYNLRIKNEPRTQKIIITTSRLVEKNGIDTLIRATVELSKKLPAISYKLRIVGNGPLRQELEHLTKSLNIESLVEFVGEIPPDQIPDELSKADIFVRPSRSEGLGISFLEAMAAGLPIVATNVGGIPDLLKDSETGLFCKVDDPIDLANKLGQLLEDSELANRLGEQGRSLVGQKFDWNQIASAMSSIFEQTKVL